MTYIAEATFSVSGCPNPLIYNAAFPDLGAHDLPRPLAGAPEVSTSPTTPELEPLKRPFDRDGHDRGFRRSVLSGPHHYILPLNAGDVENDPAALPGRRRCTTDPPRPCGCIPASNDRMLHTRFLIVAVLRARSRSNLAGMGEVGSCARNADAGVWFLRFNVRLSLSSLARPDDRWAQGNVPGGHEYRLTSRPGEGAPQQDIAALDPASRLLTTRAVTSVSRVNKTVAAQSPLPPLLQN